PVSQPRSTTRKEIYPRILLKRQKVGGEQIGQLLKLYWEHLRILAETQLDGRLRRRVSPSDIVQETFFEANRDFGQFRGGSEREFMAWLRRILANNLLRAVERHVLTEKRDVRREISLEEIGASLERSAIRIEQLLVDPHSPASSQSDRQDRLLALSVAMSSLPDDYRRVLVWRHLDGISFNVIGERLDRSAGACRMLWLRAIDQMKQHLNREGWL
ncbi:MAG: sigma-70 family RNA polymerase sigma factor, partial [Planctomycetota bacterium]|nr:sigma-70 family RNA polymerase sigma factor [Planctomycetota bacterium]